MALRQILTAEQLQQKASKAVGMRKAVRTALTTAREKFEADLPGIKDVRDGLVHFEDWSRGRGGGPQRERRAAGEPERDIAKAYSGFGYDPGVGSISTGQFSFDIDKAGPAAADLSWAILVAGREIDANATCSPP